MEKMNSIGICFFLLLTFDTYSLNHLFIACLLAVYWLRSVSSLFLLWTSYSCFCWLYWLLIASFTMSASWKDCDIVAINPSIRIKAYKQQYGVHARVPDIGHKDNSNTG